LGGEFDAEKWTGLREGEVLAGKYRIERVLGSGGMGMVLAAHHVGLDTKVAIKLLRPEMLGNAEAVGRFAIEARAAARITNEHVARVFDVGALDDGAPYMVMEFLDGSDLSERLRVEGRLPVTQAVDFVLQACEALAEAHDAGIVHRDLKPSNLFCVRRPSGSLCIKVLDFGISKLSIDGAQSSLTMTATAAVMGTPFYMSPEQMESARDVDSRTDIWSLGIILFELIAGHRPFGGQTLPEICFRIATHPAPRVRETRPEVPPGLEEAISRCLEKRRTERFSTVAELAGALTPFGSEPTTGPGSRASGPSRTLTRADGERTATGDDEGGFHPPQTLSALGHTKGSAAARWPARLWLLGGVAAFAAVAMMIFVTRSPPEGPPPPSSAAGPAVDAAAALVPAAVAPRPPDPAVPPPAIGLIGTSEGPLVEMREAAPVPAKRPRKQAVPVAESSRTAEPHLPAASLPPSGAGPVSGTNPFDERL
jgi:serine/threonine protein kinase